MRTYDSRPVRNKPSRFKGVYLTENKRWQAILNTGKQYLRLGTFDTEEEAAIAYDRAALQHRGPDTFLNFRDLGRITDPIIEADSALIPLKNGKYFRIDKADLDAVSRYYWHGTNTIRGANGRNDSIALHSLLLGHVPSTHRVVHVNGDRYDYRRANLMIVPRVLHQGMSRKIAGAKHSRYKGVKRRNATTWHARFLGKHIGAFPTEEEAARAYDDAARKRYGALAALNFPLPGERSCLDRAA